MLVDTIETLKVGHLTVSIYPDRYAPNPFTEWDTFNGAKIIDPSREYDIGADPELSRLAEEANGRGRDGLFERYLSMLGYQGRRLWARTGSQDSFEGAVIARPEDITDCDDLGAFLDSMAAVMQTWIEGGFTAYTITDAEGNTIDSCGGFDTFDCCVSEATDAAQWHLDDRESSRVRRMTALASRTR